MGHRLYLMRSRRADFILCAHAALTLSYALTPRRLAATRSFLAGAFEVSPLRRTIHAPDYRGMTLYKYQIPINFPPASVRRRPWFSFARRQTGSSALPVFHIPSVQFVFFTKCQV